MLAPHRGSSDGHNTHTFQEQFTHYISPHLNTAFKKAELKLVEFPYSDYVACVISNFHWLHYDIDFLAFPRFVLVANLPPNLGSQDSVIYYPFNCADRTLNTFVLQ